MTIHGIMLHNLMIKMVFIQLIRPNTAHYKTETPNDLMDPQLTWQSKAHHQYEFSLASRYECDSQWKSWEYSKDYPRSLIVLSPSQVEWTYYSFKVMTMTVETDIVDPQSSVLYSPGNYPKLNLLTWKESFQYSPTPVYVVNGLGDSYVPLEALEDDDHDFYMNAQMSVAVHIRNNNDDMEYVDLDTLIVADSKEQTKCDRLENGIRGIDINTCHFNEVVICTGVHSGWMSMGMENKGALRDWGWLRNPRISYSKLYDIKYLKTKK